MIHASKKYGQVETCPYLLIERREPLLTPGLLARIADKDDRVGRRALSQPSLRGRGKTGNADETSALPALRHDLRGGIAPAALTGGVDGGDAEPDARARH